MTQNQKDAAFNTLFTQISGEFEITTPDFITIEHRQIEVIAQHASQKVLWCNFAQLCETPRSHADYVKIAQNYHTVLLENVPEMPPNKLMQARRFTWLIDVLYDERVQLYITAHVPYEQLYTEGAFANEFLRTVSRLKDMTSADYAQKVLLRQHG